MPKIAYSDKRVQTANMDLILWADRVATDYANRGLGLTLRQLYYQGVQANVFPNTEQSYKRLGNIVNDGRMLGLIDWNHLTDRGREAHGTGWIGVDFPREESLLDGLENRMMHDVWRGQVYRPEVWVEKQALEEVAQRACSGFRMGYIACKGYMSQSEMWEAGYNRLGETLSDGQIPVIIHIGDHDPSGIDMTRDIQTRLSLFAEQDVEVRRIALNMDQIETYNPPPNPAKTTDSRYKEYRRNFGDESWELDSLRPELLIDLVQTEIRSLLDLDLFNLRAQEERDQREATRERFAEVSDRWDEVQQYLSENPVGD